MHRPGIPSLAAICGQTPLDPVSLRTLRRSRGGE